MHTYHIDAADTATESLIETALYRFLELHATASDEAAATLHTEVCGPQRRKTVRLWSAEAVTRFERFWLEFRRERALCNPFEAGRASFAH
jgi:hypothetical protein